MGEEENQVKAEIIIKYVKTNTEKVTMQLFKQIISDVLNGATTLKTPIEKLSIIDNSIPTKFRRKKNLNKVNVSLLSTKGVNEELPLDQKERKC